MTQNRDQQADQFLFTQIVRLAESLFWLRHVLFVDEKSEIVLRFGDQADQGKSHSLFVAREQIQRTVVAGPVDQRCGKLLLLPKAKLADAQAGGFG